MSTYLWVHIKKNVTWLFCSETKLKVAVASDSTDQPVPVSWPAHRFKPLSLISF